MLVSTSQASKILGISLQGVHYRIKKGLLKSKKEDGKILVFIEEQEIPKNIQNETNINNNELLKSKDEQINLLKDHITWMKEQYQSEINRLENNQHKIIDVFKSEITLLQQAYNEMKNLTLEHKKEEIVENDEIKFISVKEFFEIMRNHHKTNTIIKNIILDCIKNNDNRFIYNTKTKELIIHQSDFLDLI